MLRTHWAQGCNLAAALSTRPEVAARVEAAQPALVSASQRTGVPLDLLNGVAWVESRHKGTAVSKAGARGLMQVMPATQVFMERKTGTGPRPWQDLGHNAYLGAAFLQRLLQRYRGDTARALAAYNAGPGNVDKHGPHRWMGYVVAVTKARDRFNLAARRCAGNVPMPSGRGRRSAPRAQRPVPAPAPQGNGAGLGVVALIAAVAVLAGGFKW